MYYAFKTQHGFMGKVNEESKEANLGLGDAILNYKTVQSFGHENLIVENFRKSMEPADKAAFWGNVSKAFALGICTFINLMVSASMFLIAGAIITSDRFNFNMTQIFTALFAMMLSGQ
jgi:ABC-type transport system involved in Fe-S cluster assembly fused permease/ATPase subunit